MNDLRGFFGHFTSHAASYQRLDSADNAASGGGRDNPYNEPSPLAACRTGNIDWLKEEIEKDSSLVFRNYRSGKTGNLVPLLYVAVQEGHLKVAELLIRHGAEVNATYKGCTPLSMAAEKGHLKVAELLIRHGAEVNATSKGWTPLCLAAKKGHPEVAELLIRHGAEVNRARNDGSTPLYMAAQNGHTGIVRCLLKEGADPKKKWEMLKIGKFAVFTKSPLEAALIDAKDQEIAGMIRKAIKEMKIDSANHQVQTTASGLSSYGTFNDMN